MPATVTLHARVNCPISGPNEQMSILPLIDENMNEADPAEVRCSAVETDGVPDPSSISGRPQRMDVGSA